MLDRSAYSQAVEPAVQWHEGMLLSPHHFQQADRHAHSLLNHRMVLGRPYSWGVVSMSLDDDLLLGGLVRVTDLSAVLPNGTVVQLQSGESLEFDLRSAVEMSQKDSVTLWLCTPVAVSGTPQSGREESPYRSIPSAPMPDAVTAGNEQVIPVLRPQVKLLAGDTPGARYSALPLLRLRFRNEAWSVVEFQPPCFFVEKNSVLGRRVGEVVSMLRRRALSLSDRVTAPSFNENDPSSQEIRLILRSISISLPRLEAVVAVGTVHPFDLFLELCDVAGRIATLTEGMVPPVFHPYNHNELSRCFGEILSFVDRVITDRLIETHSAYPFRFSNGDFSLSVDSAWMNKPIFVAVRAATGATDADVKAWVETALLGMKSQIPSMRERRILGLRRVAVERDGQLIPGRGVQLYQLNFSPGELLANEELVLTNSTERFRYQEPSEVVLYVRNS